jgi:sporulation protein YlmC with PRC-barrel domain
MRKGTHVSWLALIGALAVAPLGTAAFGADSTTTPATTPPAATDTMPAATDTTAAPPKQKGADVTVIQVDPNAPAKSEGTLGQLVPGQMTAEDIIGKSVVNAKGETIGDVNDLVLDKDKAAYAVLSVGGFLGIGTTYVAVPFNKIQITSTGDGGSKVQIVADVTADDLKALAKAQRGETTAEAGRSKPAETTDTTIAPAAGTAPDTTTSTTKAPATVATDTTATTTTPRPQPPTRPRWRPPMRT